MLVALLAGHDLSQSVRIRGQLSEKIIETHNPNELAVLVHDGDPAHTVDLHAFEGLGGVLGIASDDARL